MTPTEEWKSLYKEQLNRANSLETEIDKLRSLIRDLYSEHSKNRLIIKEFKGNFYERKGNQRDDR